MVVDCSALCWELFARHWYLLTFFNAFSSRMRVENKEMNINITWNSIVVPLHIRYTCRIRSWASCKSAVAYNYPVFNSNFGFDFDSSGQTGLKSSETVGVISSEGQREYGVWMLRTREEWIYTSRPCYPFLYASRKLFKWNTVFVNYAEIEYENVLDCRSIQYWQSHAAGAMIEYGLERRYLWPCNAEYVHDIISEFSPDSQSDKENVGGKWKQNILQWQLTMI